MPQALSPIPLDVPIVDTEGGGGITAFFRLRWQELINSFTLTPSKAQSSVTGQTAALVTATLLTTTQAGRYRITVYLRKTVADGVASTLTLTLGWTDSGTPLTKAFAAVATDTASAEDSQTWTVNADTAAPITWAVAYTSTTPNKMTWNGYAVVELLA